ncbi:hypothetical protein [Sphingomicrobium nitratireducens]|uniref:hypothetical protein n=1 Tax=Sphingomicrobium nitratireducens TaxID=2964666 RepID=UPI0022400404|nr:hypothetical protein [Sphingomicrobium nitratireducens]
MRTIIVILILVVVALIAVIGTGMVDIRQTQAAKVPEFHADENGIAAKGGRQPAFDVETGTISVGSETKAVTVPTLDVQPAKEKPASGSTKSKPAG